MMRLAWPALVGIALGVLAPLGPRARETVAPIDPVAEPEPAPAAAPQDPPEPTACVDPLVVDAAREAARSASADLESVQEAFLADWGRPPEPPEGHLVLEQATLLNQRLADLDAALVDVDCTFYPCTIVVASAASLDSQAIADAAGVPVAQVASGSVYVDGRNHPVDAVTVIDEAGLDPDEARWVRRLRERHQFLATDAYLDDLGQRAAP